MIALIETVLPGQLPGEIAIPDAQDSAVPPDEPHDFVIAAARWKEVTGSPRTTW